MDTLPAVLLVDENADSLEAMRQFLHQQGYPVYCARDGERGLEMADRLSPQLVITDMLLPGKSGFHVLEQIKTAPNPARVVMLGAYGGVQQSQLAQFLGAEEFIRKPVSLNRLLETVTRLCPLPAGVRREPIGGPHLLDKVGVHGGS